MVGNQNQRHSEEIIEYFEFDQQIDRLEVIPYVPDVLIDEKKLKVGYEINFTKYYYEYTSLRSTKDIRADIQSLRAEIEGLRDKA